MEPTEQISSTKHEVSSVSATKVGTVSEPGSVVSGRTTTPSQVFAIVCVGIILANLDLFIVNVGLPKIAEDLEKTTLEDLSWVLNGYAVAYAALLVFFGRVAERHRRDRSFILGIGIFTVASAACAAATSVWELVAFRVAQAAGAALMTPTSIGLLLASFPPHRRGGAVRNWAAVGGFAAALGPLAGGLLVTINWRWIFLVNVPIGVIAMVIAWRKLPEVPGHDVERPSFWAALLVTAGIGSLTFSIVKVNDWGWWSPEIGFSVAASIIFLAMFVLHCRRSKNPFLDPTLFRVRQFTGAALAMTPYSITFGAMLFSVALWCESAWGWSALQTGLAIAPGPLLVPITSLVFSERLIERFGAAFVVTAGIALVVIGFCVWAAFIGLEPEITLIIVGMLLNGIGVGLAFPTLMGISTHALPSSSFATGSGVINMIRQAAMAVGVAIFVAIVGSRSSPEEQLAAFHVGWWGLAAITALALVPTFLVLMPIERGVRRRRGA
ncbi:MFS transporter [Cupriavidus necator]|uniref:MFS transporter n=1 Tax=Cupriavidus necator TaxID=106590 RepID=A0A367PIC5_CUPNE|nr:MFS transporter [Cupriavidus necator]QQX86625.1 MFS transporter [Cupriavidus necator]RCJ06855.1 MFS transporter [Cupriavidus necator]